jgi:uncharacterized membrane protein
MPNTVNESVLVEQLRGHVQSLTKRIKAASLLCGALIIALITGFQSIEMFSIKLNFFYGSIVTYLVVFFIYYLCSTSVFKIKSLALRIDDSDKVTAILSQEPGFYNPFSTPVISIIIQHLMPVTIYFIMINLLVPLTGMAIDPEGSSVIILIRSVVEIPVAFIYGLYLYKLYGMSTIFIQKNIVKAHVWVLSILGIILFLYRVLELLVAIV